MTLSARTSHPHRVSRLARRWPPSSTRRSGAKSRPESHLPRGCLRTMHSAGGRELPSRAARSLLVALMMVGAGGCSGGEGLPGRRDGAAGVNGLDGGGDGRAAGAAGGGGGSGGRGGSGGSAGSDG